MRPVSGSIFVLAAGISVVGCIGSGSGSGGSQGVAGNDGVGGTSSATRDRRCCSNRRSDEHAGGQWRQSKSRCHDGQAAGNRRKPRRRRNSNQLFTDGRLKANRWRASYWGHSSCNGRSTRYGR